MQNYPACKSWCFWVIIGMCVWSFLLTDKSEGALLETLGFGSYATSGDWMLFLPFGLPILGDDDDSLDFLPLLALVCCLDVLAAFLGGASSSSDSSSSSSLSSSSDDSLFFCFPLAGLRPRLAGFPREPRVGASSSDSSSDSSSSEDSSFLFRFAAP